MKFGLGTFPSEALKLGIERIVSRKHCAVGLTLRAAFTQRTTEWILAEAEKRAGVATVPKDQWRQVAHRTDDAKNAHEQARAQYVAHVIACRACKKFVKRKPA
jgi:hypothetical protein